MNAWRDPNPGRSADVMLAWLLAPAERRGGGTIFQAVLADAAEEYRASPAARTAFPTLADFTRYRLDAASGFIRSLGAPAEAGPERLQ